MSKSVKKFIDEFPVQSISKSKLMVPGLFFALVVLVIVSVFLFIQYSKTKSLLNNPQQATKEQIADLVKKVGVLIELPNEEPTIATVTNKDALKNQPFFAKSENGDKVLIFTQAKKAILYRPSENKIIEVAPINIGDQQTATGSAAISPQPNLPSPTQTSSVKLAVYNGTKTPGLANTYAGNIAQKFPSVEIVNKTNAVGDYTKTLVIDLTGKNKALVQKIAQELSGETGSLPSGENKPDADILVIAGK